ncbi:MAG: DNA helicase, partial [Prevotella sp.]|nr:DNA helicase [Prevotella sp.]
MAHSENYITPNELFERVAEILRCEKDNPSINKMMHETLVLTCAEGLKDTRHGFGNLSSQVDVLCKMHHVKPSDCVAIQKMRRDSNIAKPLSPEVVQEDCKALAVFISMVFHTQIPSLVVANISFSPRKHHLQQHIDYKYIRCIVEDWDETYLYVTVDQDGCTKPLTVDYVNTKEYIDLSYLKDIIHVGTQLNLLDCTMEKDVAVPRVVVVEPDYLLDISSIAACFEDYGHHPLSFVMNKMKPKANTPQILIGNFAGNALDDIINNRQYQINETIKNNFREKALEYCTCEELNIVDFKEKIAVQVKNIQQIVEYLFKTYDRDKAILEPSFVCEKLGLQGRVDLMTTDMRLLV